jgi:superfamily I DNA and/or RNA helicase
VAFDKEYDQVALITLRRYPVGVATCSNTADNQVVKDVKPDALITDESAFGLEMEVIMAVININSVKLSIFVGDEHQLRPVVPSHRREHPYAKDYYANPMSDQLLYSFPERLKDAGMPSVLFPEQHRMVTGLSQPASGVFYGGRLKDHPRSTVLQSRPLAQATLKAFRKIFGSDFSGDVPHMWIDVPNGTCVTAPGSFSRSNPHNIRVAVDFLLDYLKHIDYTVAPQDIMVVLPYRAQADGYRSTFQKMMRIKQSDQDFEYDEILVSTINAIPGSKTEIEILDAVVSKNRFGGVGLLADRHRLNVAITRAKTCLVIIDDRNMTQSLWEQKTRPSNTDEAVEGEETDDTKAHQYGYRHLELVIGHYITQRCITTKRPDLYKQTLEDSRLAKACEETIALKQDKIEDIQWYNCLATQAPGAELQTWKP